MLCGGDPASILLAATRLKKQKKRTTIHKN
jgi:hypothetical protein